MTSVLAGLLEIARTTHGKTNPWFSLVASLVPRKISEQQACGDPSHRGFVYGLGLSLRLRRFIHIAVMPCLPIAPLRFLSSRHSARRSTACPVPPCLLAPRVASMLEALVLESDDNDEEEAQLGRIHGKRELLLVGKEMDTGGRDSRWLGGAGRSLCRAMPREYRP